MVKNEAIGEVECPHKSCVEVCKVFRFRQRAGEAKLTRFAGKLYADCPTHGRIGGDGRQATQDYILENGKIWGKTESADASKGPPAPTPATKTPAKTPADDSSRSPPSPSKSPKTPEKSPATPTRPWWQPLID